MSFRGGRGGRFGGRGGGGAGAPMTEEERKAFSYAFPTPTYPPVAVPLQSKPTRVERLCASQFLQFRNQVRDGPFYIGSYVGPLVDESTGKSKKKTAAIAIEIDEGQQLNDGIKRYTDRYTKKRRIGTKPAVDEHPYVIEFFPKELYEPMGHITSGSGKKINRKLDLSRFTAELLLTEAGDELDDDPEARERKLKAKIEELKASAGSGNDKDDDKSDDNDEPEEEFDDEFESDDDDDYNAEKYFDDGEGMDDDDDGNDEAAY
ncbi:uncharacterized protein SAPINGB_P003723 [Magnusiomyces paraingens]|uniref:DNA-directed RNA polymerase III subunit n=1 Tax=Magnusiomyces paraingens TaxID=2606893 RepID=A0A5E8BYA0_9ASCO|nr:uncharacterized protein SAPINGB_P003723 [Saprochaete ingens]VVT53735.1 unnamed protein product [Saprochaete ingens]